MATIVEKRETRSKECPCSQLVSIEAIWGAMAHEDQHRGLIDWLSGGASLSCTKTRDCSVRRVMASFHILKEIRTACKPFLESGRPTEDGSTNTFKSPQKKTATSAPPPKYEDQFPSLGLKPDSGKNAIHQKKACTDPKPKPKQGKKKKRIRPVAAVAPLQGSSGVWGEIAKQPPQPTTTVNSTKKTGAWGVMNKDKVTTKSDSGLVGAWGKHAIVSHPNNSPLQTPQKTTQSNESNRIFHQPLSVHNDNCPETRNKKGAKAWIDIATVQSEKTSNSKGVSTSPPSTPVRHPSTIGSQNNTTPSLQAMKLDDRTKPSNNPVEVKAPRQVTFSPQTAVAHTPTKSSESSINGNLQETVFPASNEQVDRFVDAYCTLILHNLVPSTALEFHLLLRLLHASNKVSSQNSPSPIAILNQEEILAPVFSNEHEIRLFAIKALKKLSPQLKVFGIPFLKDLVQSTTFRMHLPDLTKEFEQVIQNEVSVLNATEQASLFSGVSQTALLTLPFRHDRDSRHHFKSRDEMAIYKNREENRDAFLYQLRSFLNVKGRVLDTVQAQKSMDKIKSNFRVVLEGVMNVNMPWFVQFFCELLLQVGLVPLEETDKELLSIAGKEKLQKLHKRFSSKVGGAHSTKTSSKLTTVASKRQANSSIPPEEQAREHFPGHQEFFYQFIISSDSYRFNGHLRNQLVHLIRAKQQSDSYVYTENVEADFLKMQMLSKFLGVLLFSPSWHEVSGNATVLKKGCDVPPPDGLQQLQSDDNAGLDLLGLVKKSQTEGNLTIVIPWVTELLKMASWDTSIRTRSEIYTMLIVQLRQLQHAFKSSLQDYITQKRKTPSFIVAVWCLEAFFGEHVGLTEAASFQPQRECPPPTIHIEVVESQSEDQTGRLDLSPLAFSTSTLFAVNPQLEELFSLVTHLSRDDSTKGSTKSPGISRKLRPLMVRSGLAPPDGTGDPTRSARPIEMSTNERKSAAASSTLAESGSNSLEAKMVDSFFHQHKALKDICEFSVQRILKCVLSAIPERLAQASSVCGLPDNESMGPESATAAVDDGLKFLRASLEEKMEQALVLLEPPNTPAKVHQLAVSLAVARGYDTGAPRVQELVAKDLNSIQRSLFQCNGVVVSDEGEPNGKEVLKTQLCNLTSKLNELRSRILVESTVTSFDRILDSVQSLEPMVDAWVNSKNPRVPPEKQLRDHFEAVAELDRYSLRLVDFCVNQRLTSIDSCKFWKALAGFLRVASKLSPHPRRGFARVRRHLWNLQSLEDLIGFGVAKGTSCEVSDLLATMVKGCLLSEERLEESLVRSREFGRYEINGVVTDALKRVDS